MIENNYEFVFSLIPEENDSLLWFEMNFPNNIIAKWIKKYRCN